MIENHYLRGSLASRKRALFHYKLPGLVDRPLTFSPAPAPDLPKRCPTAWAPFFRSLQTTACERSLFHDKAPSRFVKRQKQYLWNPFSSALSIPQDLIESYLLNLSDSGGSKGKRKSCDINQFEGGMGRAESTSPHLIKRVDVFLIAHGLPRGKEESDYHNPECRFPIPMQADRLFILFPLVDLRVFVRAERTKLRFA